MERRRWLATAADTRSTGPAPIRTAPRLRRAARTSEQLVGRGRAEGREEKKRDRKSERSREREGGSEDCSLASAKLLSTGKDWRWLSHPLVVSSLKSAQKAGKKSTFLIFFYLSAMLCLMFYNSFSFHRSKCSEPGSTAANLQLYQRDIRDNFKMHILNFVFR